MTIFIAYVSGLVMGIGSFWFGVSVCDIASKRHPSDDLPPSFQSRRGFVPSDDRLVVHE